MDFLIASDVIYPDVAGDISMKQIAKRMVRWWWR
jgi:hypothetical protein